MTFRIHIPKNNIPERSYIIGVIFNEFLGVDYELVIEERSDYFIDLNSGKSIIVSDDFFNKFTKDHTYLNKRNIPESVIFSENQFTVETNIPVIFGNQEVEVSENQIKCGIDIFASSFFMLTRWEEHVVTKKDNHGRTPDTEQLVFKMGIHYRPIVNEYVEMLRNMMAFLGLKIENLHHFRLQITHDIDFFLRYDTFNKRLKALAGDLFKRKSLKKAVSTISQIKKIKKGINKDPYDTFEYLMNISERAGTKSIFYFIPALIGEADAAYNISDPAVQRKMTEIINRGHKVGVHGAYRSFRDQKLFEEELKRFPEEIIITKGRQHYLRFENPITWQIYEATDLSTDSTLGYMTDAGFRAGTCFEYTLFNILTRKKLDLKEIPLIVMEQALVKKFSDRQQFFKKILGLKATVAKYSGTFVLLWHNNNFHVDEWEGFTEIYEQILNQ